jgi:hypothetical protein
MADRRTRPGIYDLHLIGEGEYGDYVGHVVIAVSEQDARVIAGRACKRNGIVWADPATATCRVLGLADPDQTPRIVMSEMLGE